MPAPVLDLTGRQETFVARVEYGPAFEFLVSLCAFGFDEPDTLDAGPAWFEGVRSALSTRFLEAWERAGPSAGKVWVNLAGLAMLEPVAREVPQLLDRVASLDPLELRLYLLGSHVPAYQARVSPELLRRAALGDTQAQAGLLADRLYFAGHADPALRPLLALDEGHTREVALTVLGSWYEDVFRAGEAEVRETLARDGEANRALLDSMPAERVIETASGIDYVPKAGISTVYLVPQLAVRPWVLLCEHDEARLFCYPATEEAEAADETAPPPRLLRLARALGDERRLRMLKELSRSSASLQELADRFDLPKTTAHHHLAILRTAGLVRMSSELERRHRLRPEALDELCDLLERFLGDGEEGRETEGAFR
jgi:DNA-binding transcriptional ArsR family regulator